ncbi:ATP-dependent DNA helicase srs2 [Golovinomyces cichoracearum]|uniref:DNA 3'-5' helicase n=1 Tax=Golovinomyces cichoracearum TaxID=62708 RepID=A0A420HNL8_9PEZI|nr:ATP-dependent DNA helicase srs2 [Golovinomyces cichoracearum]
MLHDNFLTNLNRSQKEAVTADLQSQLSILAGPGSGKTYTLAARIAWLLSKGIHPWNIIVTTFTVKTAQEMKERVGRFVDISKSSKLIIGTFHSIARRYLSQYGHLIDIKNNFGIADSADSLAIIKRIVKKHELNIDPKVARNRISGIKARGGIKYYKEIKSGPSSIESRDFELCYQEYGDTLRRSNLLDYDDLLLRCVDLLRDHPKCVANVEAVLIDEFQDTNIVQFDLMRLFAANRKRITIVGDPDQSIYSFRAAEIQNYRRLKKQYPESITVTLEENYRSSGAILLTALNIIEQDNERVAKTLVPTNTVGTSPVFRHLSDAQIEAEWISTEIMRVIGMTGGLLDLGDFSILLRSASLSRLIESNFSNRGLAYRMVGGVRFYDRVEVKIVIEYLRVVNQPDNDDAVSNILNVPSRRIGDATIQKLMEEASKLKISLWSLIQKILIGKRPHNIKLTKQVIQGLSSFREIIEAAKQKFMNPHMPFSLINLLKYILDKTKFEEWLLTHHDDIEKLRWSNVEELLTQATEFQNYLENGFDDESLPIVDDVQQKGKTNLLAQFLANIALSSGTEAVDGENQSRIVISTIHAAKGLEWPVVFIPAVYQGSIPHSRAEDFDEERRLLYVAMTRAKALLYLSRPLKSSRGERTQSSQFMSPKSLTPFLNHVGPVVNLKVVQSISQILRRAIPTAEAILNSSSLLPSELDNLFPTYDKSDEQNKDARLDLAKRNTEHEIDQKGSGLWFLGPEEPDHQIWRKSDFHKSFQDSISRSSNSSLKTGFINAGSHLKNIAKGSKYSAISNPKQTVHKHNNENENHFSKAKAKSELSTVETQKTLLGYFDRPDPKVMEDSKDAVGNDVKYDVILPRNVKSFAPHRPKDLMRSRLSIDLGDRENFDNYFFLPSSPTSIDSQASRRPPEGPPEGPVINSEFPVDHDIKNLIPTADLIQKKSITVKKTLGVKRSMDGWSIRKDFTPPLLKKKNLSLRSNRDGSIVLQKNISTEQKFKKN